MTRPGPGCPGCCHAAWRHLWGDKQQGSTDRRLAPASRPMVGVPVLGTLHPLPAEGGLWNRPQCTDASGGRLLVHDCCLRVDLIILDFCQLGKDSCLEWELLAPAGAGQRVLSKVCVCTAQAMWQGSAEKANTFPNPRFLTVECQAWECARGLLAPGLCAIHPAPRGAVYLPAD